MKNKSYFYYKELEGLPSPKKIKGYTLHREDGPAFYDMTDSYEQIYESRWYLDGELHRLDGPAISYSRDNEIFREEWHEHGKERTSSHYCAFYMGKDDQENLLIEFLSYKLEDDSYYIRVFSLESPQVLIEEEWRKNSKRHRENAPAVIYYEKDGVTIKSSEWWLEGKKVE